MPPPTSTQDIYGFYDPDRTDDILSVDKDPVRLPYILSADELDPFTLPPIKADREIRLIEVLPPRRRKTGAGAGTAVDSSDDEPLRCTMRVCALDDAPEYEALSYVWGSMHRHLPVSVVVDDDEKTEEALFATPQLLMALRRLRRTSESRRLWIDQLCIAQDDIGEKGAQIQLMGRIYNRAMRVVVWLGEDGGRAEVLAETLRLFGGDADGEGNDVKRIERLVDVCFMYHYDTVEIVRAVTIYEVMQRPWFTRAWIFQEASLARELLLQYGGLEVRFEALKRLCDALAEVEVARGIHRDRNLAMSTGGFEMMQLIQQTRQEVLRPSSTSQTAGSLDDSRLLCKLLQVLRRVQCHDPRDLIFAFLSFQGTEDIVATAKSYDQPPEKVWRDATERIIRTSSSLDVFAALSGDTERALKLPSWVPYWADCFPYSRPIATPVSRFRASRRMPHVWTPHDDPSKLRVKGKIIDRVQVLLSIPMGRFQSSKHSVDIFLFWDCLLQVARSQLCEYEDATKSLGNYLPVKLNTIEADLLRTVLADGALGPEQPLRQIHEMLGTMADGWPARELRESRSQRELTDEQMQMLRDYERLENLVLVAELKHVFFTEQVQLGMAPHAVKVGDEIAILHGSKTPCLLRRVEGESNKFRVISQCFLQGWMYGNSPRDWPHPRGTWWDEKQDEFVLV